MPNSAEIGQKIEVKIKIADKVNEFELSHIIEVGKKVTKSKSSSGKKSRKVSDNNQEIDNTGGIPVPRRLNAEKLKKEFPDSFKDTYSVFCIGDQWFLNLDNKDLKNAENDKNFRDYGAKKITDAFETSLLLYGLSLKKGEASDVEVNESLSKMSELTIPIVDGINFS